MMYHWFLESFCTGTNPVLPVYPSGDTMIYDAYGVGVSVCICVYRPCVSRNSWDFVNLSTSSHASQNSVVIFLRYTGDFLRLSVHGITCAPSSNMSPSAPKSFSIMYTHPVQLDVAIFSINTVSHAI